MEPIVRFYFSFRSPYAWFAAERWSAELGDTRAERIPFFPTPGRFPNDPTLFPAKYAYVIRDVGRLAHRYGLTVTRPHSLDTDWESAHAAFLGVQAALPERAEAFMLEMYRSRFSRGLDVGNVEVIEDAARRASIDAAVAASAAASPALRAAVVENLRIGQERDGIFGAPSFVYRDELFWGHDRMPHLRERIQADLRAPAEARAS
jgi:2-hydroxychromene-2-carboxylate isomerase